MKQIVIAAAVLVLLCACNNTDVPSASEQPEIPVIEISMPELSQEASHSEEPSAQSAAASAVDPQALLGDWYRARENNEVLVLKFNDESSCAYLYGRYATEGSIFYPGTYTLAGDTLTLDLVDGFEEEPEEEDAFRVVLRVEMDGEALVVSYVSGDVFHSWEDTAQPLSLVREDKLLFD